MNKNLSLKSFLLIFKGALLSSVTINVFVAQNVQAAEVGASEYPLNPANPVPTAEKTSKVPRLKSMLPVNLYSSTNGELAALDDDAYFRHFPALDVLPGYYGQDRNSIIVRDFGATPSPPQHLLPESMAPIRRFLLSHGINVQLTYVSEPMWNVAGGRERGGDYAAQLSLQLDTDLKRLTHLAFLDGFTTHMMILQRSGRSLTNDRVGDHDLNLVGVYGVGNNVIAKLGYFYIEKDILDHRINLAVGRMAVAMDFATSPVYSSFLSIGLAPIALKTAAGFEATPNSVWGGRARLRPFLDNYLSFGAYQVSPNYGGISGWSWFEPGSQGVILPVEDAWTPYIGRQGLVGHYRVGFAYNSVRYPSLAGTIPAQSITEIHMGGPRHRDSFWVLGDQMLFRTGHTEYSGVIAFGGYVHNTQSITTFQDQIFGGLLTPSPIPGRKDDQFGFLFSYYHYSTTLRRGEEIRISDGLSPGKNIYGPQSDSNSIEVFYNIPVFRGIRFSPDYEYFVRPGGSSYLRSASFVGFKTSILL
ncbi:carbohydrate porin [Nguyenibacter vanlangensis]|uniref:Carbohydrate porin n=1 Tax=Nguyenibacter vanlangensis TaxID=1216886 RepID=A0ABZ3D0L2_9PROT